MNNLSFQDIRAEGEFRRRADASLMRLEEREYEPEAIFKEGGYSWPGDWEGRTMLAWTLLGQATGRKPRHLEEAMILLPSRLNEKGYFGPVYPFGTVDEQQLSGNSWFLRAICEYYLWTGEPRTLDQIRQVVEHLLLPASGHYAEYPTLPEQRIFNGFAVGELQEGKVGNWHLSTDIGCAFIMLDGATQAYRIAPRPELKALIDEMVGKFASIDLIGLSFQTHATLSALRGLLRHYETTGERKLLDLATRSFDLYLERGMTENYANYNWFGRPTWTEPCAVVDSYMVAVDLWRHLGHAAYLNAAHHIYYNGLGYGQRPNGGFGCDNCSGAEGKLLAPKEGLFEAYWCCTMRGGEGLSRAIENCYMLNRQEVTLPFFENSAVKLPLERGRLELTQTTQYPYNGYTRLEVMANASLEDEIALRLFLPSWVDVASALLRMNGQRTDFSAENGFIVFRGKLPAGTVLEFEFEIGLRIEKLIGFESKEKERAFTYRHGPLILGIDKMQHPVRIEPSEHVEPLGNGRYRLPLSTGLLAPINDMLDLAWEEALHNQRQVLFES